MIEQKIIHETNKYDFDRFLSDRLKGGWRVVPGTFKVESTSMELSLGIFQNTQYFFIVIEIGE